MPRPLKRPRYTLEEDLDSESQAQGLLSAQDPEAAEDDSSSSSSPTSSSSSSSSPSSSSSSSSLILSIPGTPEESANIADTLSSSQGPLGASLSSPGLASAPLSQPISQEVEVSCASQALPRCVIDLEVSDLIMFLLLKYHTKELITKEEMLSRVLTEYQDHFHVIFRETCECLQLVFGLDMKEVDPGGQSYVLVTALGLTYDGLEGDEHSMPKTGFLILILSIIFMEGNRVPEEKMWEKLDDIEVCAGREHSIFGDARELITRIFVQEQYVEYRQVPNSDPACYEFLWGPRAHAETSKMKILEFLAQVNGCDPTAYPDLYEEALRDQQERAQAEIAANRASASSSAMSSGFSCPVRSPK